MAQNDATIIIGADVSSATSAINKLNRSLAAVKVDALTNLAGKALSVGQSFVGASNDVRKLQQVLKVVTGSADAASSAFSRINQFAQTTQFTVNDLSSAYIQLKTAGIEPTERILRTFADSAAVTTDQLGSLQAMTDLLSRTTAGGLGLEDLNRLADRGIPVWKILQEQLGLTRLEITDFGKSAEGANKIINALLTTMETEYSGAAAAMADSADTALQNMSSEWEQLVASVMAAGLDSTIAGIANNVGTAIKAVRTNIGEISLATSTVVSNIQAYIENLRNSVTVSVIKMKAVWPEFFQLVNDGWRSVVQIAEDSINAMIDALNKIKLIGDPLEHVKLSAGEVFDVQTDITTQLQLEDERHKSIITSLQTELSLQQQALQAQKEKEASLVKVDEMQKAAVGATGGGPMVPMSGSATQGAGVSMGTEDVGMSHVDAYVAHWEGIREKLAEHIDAEQIMLEQSYTWQLDQLQQLNDRKFISDEQYAAAKANIEKQMTTQTVGAVGDALNALGQHNKTAFKMAKAFNIGQAIMNTYTGVTKALAEFPPPFSFAMAGAQLAMGMANVASIRKQSYQGRMFGGSVTGNTPYIVGERGPELFTPGRTGTITPNDELTKDKTANVSFNITANDASGFDELLADRKPMIIGMIRQAVNEQPGLLK